MVDILELRSLCYRDCKGEVTEVNAYIYTKSDLCHLFLALESWHFLRS